MGSNTTSASPNRVRGPYERLFTERIEEEAAALIRKQFWKDGGIAADAAETLDPQDWFGAEATARILAIFGQTPCEAPAIAAYPRAGAMLAEWWEADDDRRRDRNRERRERNHETQTAVVLPET